jgi:hypothetical protein
MVSTMMHHHRIMLAARASMLTWGVLVFYEFTQNLQGTQTPSPGNSIPMAFSEP